MTIHPNSVLSKEIKAFDSLFYFKLADMENFCYEFSERAGGNEENYAPFFLSLSAAIVSWINQPRSLRRYINFTTAIYNYRLFEERGIDINVDKENLKARSVISIGGFINLIKNEAVDRYDDLIQTTEDLITTFEAPTIETDIDIITSEAQSLDMENQIIADLESEMSTDMQKEMHRLLYDDDNRGELPLIQRRDQYDYIFEELGYKEITSVVGGLKDLDPL